MQNGRGKVVAQPWLASIVITGLVAAYHFHFITKYGSDVVGLWEHGKLLLLVPLVLSPPEFILLAQLFRNKRPGKSFVRRGDFLALLMVLSMPFVAIESARACVLDSVDVPRAGMGELQLNRLQRWQLSGSVFPFPVAYEWRTGSVRLVFRRAPGRPQTVRDVLATRVGT